MTTGSLLWRVLPPKNHCGPHPRRAPASRSDILVRGSSANRKRRYLTRASRRRQSLPPTSQNFSGGLLGRLAALMGVDPEIRRNLHRRRWMTNCAVSIATTRCSRGSCRGHVRRRPASVRWCCEYAVATREILSKNLTRRANHRHSFIIARTEPAPGNRLRAFSFGLPGIGRQPRAHHSP